MSLPRIVPLAVLGLLLLGLAACGTASNEIVTRTSDREYRYPYTAEGFIVAAETGDVKALEQFLDRGMDVNARGKLGNTALHAAVEKQHELAVKYLLEAGADPNIQNEKGYTPLSFAIMNDSIELLDLLLEAGARP